MSVYNAPHVLAAGHLSATVGRAQRSRQPTTYDGGVTIFILQAMSYPAAACGPHYVGAHSQMFCHAHALGLEAAFDMVAAPRDRTFFYRNKDKRVIDARVLNESRLHSVRGPLVYTVTDSSGVLRYVGKWVSKTPLYSRWFRHEHLHHQTSSRMYYLAELDGGRGPLRVWSASAAELRPRLGRAGDRSDTEVAEALEALWISRWKAQLWNKQTPSVPSGFTDGEYWQNEL